MYKYIIKQLLGSFADGCLNKGLLSNAIFSLSLTATYPYYVLGEFMSDGEFSRNIVLMKKRMWEGPLKCVRDNKYSGDPLHSICDVQEGNFKTGLHPKFDILNNAEYLLAFLKEEKVKLEQDRMAGISS